MRGCGVDESAIAVCSPSEDGITWLECAQHALGFSYVWLTGEQPGAIVGPDRIISTLPPSVANMVEIGHDDGAIYWLDVTTGRQLTSALISTSPTSTAPSSDVDREATLLAPVFRVLNDRGYGAKSSRGTLTVEFKGEAAIYEIGIFAHGGGETVFAYTFVARQVAPARRAAAADALSRINAQIFSGCFEMDPEDGQLRFRSTVFLGGDGSLTPAMADRLVHDGVCAWDKFYVPLMRVVYDNADPALAVPPRASADR